MSGVRPAAVAGTFYPGEPAALDAALDKAYADARDAALPGPPKALIAPHAGYIYSGAVAASAYRHLTKRQTVVVLGPSHHVPLHGIAVSSATAFETPIGEVSVDDKLRAAALQHEAVMIADAPHVYEHSLEVQLPFLQRELGEFTLLPLAVGRTSPTEVADLLDIVWNPDDAIAVVSTDLSHYHDYETACRQDRRTAEAIVEREPTEVDDYDACGAYPLRGLLEAARRRDLTVTLLDLRNSGDTAGDRSRVVGYGAFALN